MLHIQLREARIRHNLSQSKLARLAGVPRNSVIELENGGNFTRDTLMKVVAQLPNLRTLTLGPVTLETASADGPALRSAIEEVISAGRRALALLEAAEQQRPAGATRVDDGGISPELEKRLRSIEQQMHSAGPRRTRES